MRAAWGRSFGRPTIDYGSAPVGYVGPLVSLSSDGQHLVHVGTDGETSPLYTIVQAERFDVEIAPFTLCADDLIH